MSATATEPDAKPRRLGWLRPPKMESPDGTMALMDHLREIRYRVTISTLAILVAGAISIFFYRWIVGLVMQPYITASGNVKAKHEDAYLQLSNTGITGPFTLAVVIVICSGILLACPVWIYQLWAFVAPGLVSQEKKLIAGFMAAAVPLFLLGCLVGYWVWPKGIEVMLGFTPQGLGVMNLQDMSDFIIMEIKIILVFGVSFLLPVVLVALNLLGVVKGYQLGQARRFVIFGTCVFAAIATPSTDPFSMLALFVPMTILYFIAEFICRMLDKRKGITQESAAEFAVDVEDGK